MANGNLFFIILLILVGAFIFFNENIPFLGGVIVPGKILHFEENWGDSDAWTKDAISTNEFSTVLTQQALRLNGGGDNRATSPNIDLSGEHSKPVTFKTELAHRTSWESDDCFKIFFFDGFSFNQVYENCGTPLSQDVEIPVTDFVSNFQIRFENGAGSTAEDMYIGRIEISEELEGLPSGCATNINPDAFCNAINAGLICDLNAGTAGVCIPGPDFQCDQGFYDEPSGFCIINPQCNTNLDCDGGVCTPEGTCVFCLQGDYNDATDKCEYFPGSEAICGCIDTQTGQQVACP